MTVTEIRNILESPYERKVWKNFLQAQFTNHKLNAEDRVLLLSDKTLSKQCLRLAGSKTGKKMGRRQSRLLVRTI